MLISIVKIVQVIFVSQKYLSYVCIDLIAVLTGGPRVLRGTETLLDVSSDGAASLLLHRHVQRDGPQPGAQHLPAD